MEGRAALGFEPGVIRRIKEGAIGGHRGEPGCTDGFAGPCGARGRGCEAIAITNGANIAGRFAGEGVGSEEAEGCGIVAEQFGDKGECPGIFVGGRHSGEPHLPVETQVVGGNLRGSLVGVGGETFVGVGDPGGGICRDIVPCAFEYDIVAFLADGTESAVGIDEVEGVEGSVHDLVRREHVQDWLDTEEADDNGEGPGGDGHGW